MRLARAKQKKLLEMKNILIISKNTGLKAELEKTGLFKNIKTSQSLDNKLQGSIDILIVDNSTTAKVN